jgi:uncharacterized damage-inducible protein DinB
MTEANWKSTLLQFEENERRLAKMKPAEPMPSAEWCRESVHRTLGHLTACQSAWLPLMQHLRDGKEQASVSIHPNALFAKLGFSIAPWNALLKQFKSERKQWQSILSEIDIHREIHTPRRSWTAQTLTWRLVEHERRHIDQVPATKQS